jgi:hypothetical protein
MEQERRRPDQLVGDESSANFNSQLYPAELSAEQKMKLQAAAESGARWFMWIGGLSIVNTILTLTKTSLIFFLGLGITQVLDVLPGVLARRGAISNVTLLQVLLLILNVGIACGFIALGLFARNRRRWAFMVGMILYALDGLIFIWAKDWLGLGFHGFALFMIYGGYQAGRKLQAAEQPIAQKSWWSGG